jgi:metallophosphoesterase (TIGR00282 family)
MKILFLGDVVGKPGRQIISRDLPRLRKRLSVDVCIANGENAAGGTGITRPTAREIFNGGVDVITTGDHIWKHKDIREYLKENEKIIRPVNLPEDSPGRGWTITETADGVRVGVINVQGRTFMPPIDNPFRAVDRALKEMGDRPAVVVVDMHAEATSDKLIMGRHLDGRVTAVLGTHTHTPTADEQILPGGTAFITDVGMTGPYDSILGRKSECVIAAFTTELPVRFDVATGDVRIAGALVEADPQTGKALSIERVMKKSSNETA